ncbi:CDP-alcohol phosphatidyltransferase family protein [Microtetraspora malaysiensis]|uniref:CDP-alcohol phosphatidyltransferase family protein n=1 Tax=Microtetraspora malaysiensis TaxID=161358 RepID=UPI0008355D5A|nr:CDP-alcohol phosphatidyltransferase family protein [Microtetraspora malaysiensis]
MGAAAARETPGTTPGASTGAVAVVFATTPASRLTSGSATLLDRLTAQLRTLSVRDVQVVTRAEDTGGGLADDLRAVAKAARAASGPVAVLYGDLVAHTDALAAVLEHPSRGSRALVEPGAAGPLLPPVRTERGRIAAAGNSFHRVESPDATFRGVLQVGEAHLAGLADVAEELADLAQHRGLGRAGDSEVADLLLAGLVRAGVPVQAAPLGGLHCARASGQTAADAAVRRLAEVDERAARLRAAVKSDDGLFTTYCVSTWSPHLVRLAARLGMTPNAVTGVSVGLAVVAAIWFTAGERTAQIAGAAALLLSFALDCVDGQLARYTRGFSPLGAWLDATFDRVKEYLVYAGLAIGYAASVPAGPTGPGGIWALAVAAMLLQALRHMIDFSYAGALADAAWGKERPPIPLSVASDLSRPDDPPARRRADGGGAPLETVASRVAGLSRRLDLGTATRWAKKVVVLPIGERMALIAVTAAVFNARVTFIALLGWGAVALAYTLAGRVGRSLT